MGLGSLSYWKNLLQTVLCNLGNYHVSEQLLIFANFKCMWTSLRSLPCRFSRSHLSLKLHITLKVKFLLFVRTLGTVTFFYQKFITMLCSSNVLKYQGQAWPVSKPVCPLSTRCHCILRSSPLCPATFSVSIPISFTRHTSTVFYQSWSRTANLTRFRNTSSLLLCTSLLQRTFVGTQNVPCTRGDQNNDDN